MSAPTKCEVGSRSDDPCPHVPVGVALAWGGYFGAPDIYVCRDHAIEAASDGAIIEPIDCLHCGGSGRIAPSGEGLYAYLAASSARIAGLERSIAKATESRTRYVAESRKGDNDYRITLCDQEIAAYHRSAEYYEAKADDLRNGAAATCVVCHGTGGPPVVKTCGCGRHYGAAEWDALPCRGLMDDGDDDGGQLELRDCACGSTIAIRVENATSARRVA